MYNSCISSSFPLRVSDSCYCVDRGLQLQRCELWSVCGVSCAGSSYCCCCRLCVDRVDLNNTNLVYGLRQSSLLHWSSGSRLKFGGAGSAVYSRLSGIDRVDYGFECCNGSGRKVLSFDRLGCGGTRGKRIGGLGLIERREWRSYVAGMGEAEDLIDLLADNMFESSVVSIETEIVWPRRKKNENVCNECGRSKIKSVASDSSRGKLRREEDFISDKKSKVRKSGGSGFLQRKSRQEELIVAKPVNVAHGRRQSEGVNISSEKNEKLRKEGSGCTSFYSISSSGEIESDEDIERHGELENNTYVEEQSSKINEFRNHKNEESYDFFEETERHRNRHQGLEEKVAIGSHEGNIVVREWDRKKSEKQLVEIAVDQSQTAARTSEKRFSASEAYNSSYYKSDISHKQFHSEDNSSLKSNRQEGRIKSNTTGSTEVLRSRRGYNEESKLEGNNESDTRKKSNQLVQSSLRQDESSTSTNLTHVLNKQREQEFTRESSQQQTGTIRIQEIDDTSEVSNMRQKEQSTSVQDLKERHCLRISTVTEAELRRNSQQITNISEINRTEIQETSSSKKQPEASIKDGESSSSSVTGQSQLQMSEISQHDDRQNIQLMKGSRASLGSFVESSGLTTTVGTKTTFPQGVHTPDTKVAEEEVYGRSQYKESYKKIEARRERQRLAHESRLHKGAAESFKLSSETTVEKVHTKAEDKRTTQSMEIIAVDQPQSEGSLRIVPTTSYDLEMASQVEIENKYHLQHLQQQQGQYHRSEFEYDGSDARDDTMNVQHLSHIASEDALGSAERLANSSNVLTEEFIEQANIYLGASELQDGKLQKTRTDNEDSKKQALVKYVSAEVELESPPLSSEGSEAKDLSDEKWDVVLSSVEPPAKFKTPEVSPKAGSTSGKRTGRSLWNVIGDVARARWIFRGEGHTSPSKSGKRSSSNESARSDASGHEQDTPASKEAEERSPFYKYASPSIKVKSEKEHTKIQQAGSNAKEVKDESSISGSSPTSRFSGSGSAALGISLTFDEAKQSSSVPEVSNLAPMSSPGLLGTSTSLPSLPSRRLSRSPVIRSSSLRGRDDQTESSSAEQIDQQPSPLRLTEASETISSGHEMSFLATYRSPGLLQSSPSLPTRRSGRSPGIGSTSLRAMDDRNASSSVELSDEQPSPLGLIETSEPEEQATEGMRRKFQRTMQVPRDKFEEWEEALNRETEQHKIDDIFMREALVEAKKAADNWEVPVGAVLVKDGKIVARGCNLVEELRDSTAHAEMICIRDASTALRTWRLSETTLYVTLEPCVMCAGAILQARVTTLVWGAPNKLLGADGSWIRLFPEDGERDNTPELSDKPPAPVHPFHPKMNIRRGVLATECAQAMQQFFHLRRQNKNKSETSSPPPSCLPTPRNPAKLITKVHGLFGSSTRL